MKKIILCLGRFFANLGVFIQLLIIIALAITSGVATSVNGYNTAGLLVGILTFLVLFIIFIFSNYLFYLFLGICDSQASIAKSLEIIADKFENKNILSNSTSKENKCPNCGAAYSNNDNFCEECGTKLN